MNRNWMRPPTASTDTAENEFHLSVSLDQTRRAMVQQTAIMLIAVGLIAIAIALRVASLPQPAFIAGLIGLSVCGASIVLARSRFPIVIAASCLIGSWLTALFVIAYMRGGLQAPLLIAAPIVPMIAATVISRAAAWFVLCVILIALLTLTGLEIGGHEFPNSAPANNEFNIMRAVWIALASMMSTRLATYNAMRSKNLALELERQALTDSLTGVANRRAILASLDAEVARARRNKTRLSVLMLDIDRFKRLNDERGHLGGDQALASIAGAVAGELRIGSDAIGRWGGEEFLVVLPDTTMEDAAQVANRIRRCVVALDIRYRQDKTDVVTVTIGVAQRRGTSITTASELVDAADQALYRGKAEGRNRIVCADLAPVCAAL